MLKVIDLYSGIGAGTEALRKLGAEFEIINFAEANTDAIEIYTAINNVDESKNLGYIQQINEETINNFPKDIDILFCSMPIMRNEIGEISSLTLKTIDIINAYNPKYIVLDNVKSALYMTTSSYKYVLDELSYLGYKCSSGVIQGIDVGLPISTARTVTVAVRNDIDKEIVLLDTMSEIMGKNLYYRGQIITDKYLEPLTDEIKDRYTKGVDAKIKGIPEDAKIKGIPEKELDRRLYNTVYLVNSRYPDIQIIKQDGVYRKLTHREYMRFAGFTEASIDKALAVNDTDKIYNCITICSIVNIIESVLADIIK